MVFSICIILVFKDKAGWPIVVFILWWDCLLYRFFFKLTVNYIRTFLFVDSAYVYTVASPFDYVGKEGYWSHIGKKIFDLEDRLYFTILGVCTSNFHRGLFFKYIDCKLYEVDKKVKINDEECEYSLCMWGNHGSFIVSVCRFSGNTIV